MKILYLYQYFTMPTESGGTRAYDLATSLVDKGHDITVVTSTSDSKYKSDKRWSIEHVAGLEVHRIYLPYDNKMSYMKRMQVFFMFLWYASFRLLRLKGDVVLATSTPLTIGIPALVKKWFGRTPFIFEVRDVWPETVIAIGAIQNKLFQKVLYGLERCIYRNAVAIVPLSVDMKASIDRRYPKYKHKTEVVIPNISEINRFQKNGLNKNIIEETIGFKPRFSVVYAGTFGKVNGIDYVVTLAKQTIDIDPGLVYVLFGNGAEKENVREMAREKGVLDKNLFILEPVSKNDLPDWYASTSMGSSFVIDIEELWANSANKFFDTLAAAKPVLINHEGWQADAIRKYNMGYVLPVEVTPEAAAEFVAYTQDEELHKTQCENALQLAKEEFSLEVAVGSYEQILSDV